ncbi:MAG: bifunctional nuclease domain-containing protein [Nitrosopumilaceae archaeon]
MKIKIPKFGLKEKSPTKLKIDEAPDEDYEVVKISEIGLADPFALEGVALLTSDDGNVVPITAFSGEVARNISNFIKEKRDVVPTVYNMLEQICEESELLLVKVKLYESGNALRANLYFTGKKDLVLRNYRASDAIALATFYNVPILLRKSLLKEKALVK